MVEENTVDTLMTEVENHHVSLQEYHLSSSLVDDNAVLLSEANTSIESFKSFISENVQPDDKKSYESVINTLTTLKELNKIICDLTINVDESTDIIKEMSSVERIQRLNHIAERGIRTQVILIGLIYTNEAIKDDVESSDYKVYRELMKIVHQMAYYQSMFTLTHVFISEHENEQVIDAQESIQGGDEDNGE